MPLPSTYAEDNLSVANEQSRNDIELTFGVVASHDHLLNKILWN